MNSPIDLRYVDARVSEFIKWKEGHTQLLKKDSPSYEKYVQSVKYIIDEKIDVINGFTIEFNNDYTSITKRSTFQSMSVKQWAKLIIILLWVGKKI